jgi:apolipoprotein N-acyltransferase
LTTDLSEQFEPVSLLDSPSADIRKSTSIAPVPAVLLSISSGVLLTLGFPPFHLAWLSWAALVPLLLAVRGKTLRQAMGLGFLTGFTHFLTALYWIAYVVRHYGSLPLPMAAGVLVLLAAYLGLYPAVFAGVARAWDSRPRFQWYGLPFVWVALEWLRAHALTGFPWANLGYTQTPFATLVQQADLTGVYGVGWLVVLGNTCLAACVASRRPRRCLAFPLLMLAASLAYGTLRLDTVSRAQDAAEAMAVGLVQPAIDQSLKWDPAFQEATLERLERLSRRAAAHDPRPDLLVWPETATPFFFGIEEKQSERVKGVARALGIPILFGSPGVMWHGKQPRPLNKAFLLDSEGNVRGDYAKQHLVPFGEYVPLKRILFFVHRLVEAAGDFVPGQDPSVLRMDGTRLGVLICYEAIFPDLARSAIREGADILVNLTNDAWFGRSSAPYQHFEMARWRAVEFRVPLVRCANTGVSAMFDAAGNPCGKIPLNEVGVLVCRVKPLAFRTVYARWGDWFAWFCTLTAAGCGVYSAWGPRRRKETGSRVRPLLP